jgi:hypothetical protein
MDMNNKTYSLTSAPRACGIYLINAYGREYVGQSVGCNVRGNQHYTDLLNGTHCNSLLMKALSGLKGRARLKRLSGYTMKILEVCPSDISRDKLKRSKWLNQREDYWMARLNSDCNRIFSDGRTIKRNQLGQITNYRQTTRPKLQPSRRSVSVTEDINGMFTIGIAALLAFVITCALVQWVWG